MEDDYSNIFLSETTFCNRIVLGSLLPESVWGTLPHFLQTWLRNFISGVSLYLISGFLWCFYIYYLKRNVYIPKDAIPSKKAMLMQIHVAMKAMPWFTAFVTLSEYTVENGYTRSGISHLISLFVLPVHFKTHIALVFFEGIWSASAHDCIDAKVWPVMGAGYHTIHHTTSRHNYGHFTIWMDWMFGTLRHPIDDPPKKIVGVQD